ncbi:MAG: beta-galactosidase [Spirochaetaceae bacterium]|jgi:hypothetical protein|nr:beta-galactosidase [Spirochaetaceae bacterium]
MKKYMSGLLLIPFFFLFACGFEESEVRVEIPADFLGMVHAGSRNEEREYEMLDTLGVSWMLRTFNWSSIEPVQGEWDFSGYDTYVAGAKARGKKIFVVLAYDVGWIHGNGNSREYVPPDKVDLFCGFVKKTVERYKGRVDA